MKPYAIAILACSASKLDRAAPARDLYTGQLFRLSLQLADLCAERIVILSAKHGVVEADRVLEPYDEKLPSEKYVDKPRRAQWGEGVAKALCKTIAPGVDRSNAEAFREAGKRVLCLAPQSYVDAIGFMYGPSTWARPLKGLGIGQQKAELARLIAAQKAPSLAAMLLSFDSLHPGDAEAPVEVPANIWAELVATAKREAA